MSIGSRIKESRTSLRMTQEELARSIGVTKGAIANYENEVSTPKIELLYKLFDVLQCDANYLYQDEMKILKNEIIPTLKEKKLLSKYRTLSIIGKQKAAEYIYDLAKLPEYQNPLDDDELVYIPVAARGGGMSMHTLTKKEKAEADAKHPEIAGEHELPKF